jgi:hypothetical protein
LCGLVRLSSGSVKAVAGVQHGVLDGDLSAVRVRGGSGSGFGDEYLPLIRVEGGCQLFGGMILTAGEVVEFDTRIPHWFGNPGAEPTEILSLFGPQGERLPVRAGSTGVVNNR